MKPFKEYYEKMVGPEDVLGPGALKDDPNIIRGSWTETETELTVNINGKTGTISTVDMPRGTPRPGDLIRIRVQMERLLRKMGYDVEAPGKQGDYDVRVIFPHRYSSEDIGKVSHFKLVPKSINAAFMRDPIAVR